MKTYNMNEIIEETADILASNAESASLVRAAFSVKEIDPEKKAGAAADRARKSAESLGMSKDEAETLAAAMAAVARHKARLTMAVSNSGVCRILGK